MFKGPLVVILILLSLRAVAQDSGSQQPYRLPEPSKADSQQSQDDARTVQTPNTGDLLSACANQEKLDVACQQILLLNDFAKDLIEHTINGLGLKKAEVPVAIVAGILVSQKITGHIYKHKHEEINATYIIPQKEISLNVIHTF